MSVMRIIDMHYRQILIWANVGEESATHILRLAVYDDAVDFISQHRVNDIPVSDTVAEALKSIALNGYDTPYGIYTFYDLGDVYKEDKD